MLRVLGEGGFGQVIEVVKRDCGVHYAMKVRQTASMGRHLGRPATLIGVTLAVSLGAYTQWLGYELG